MLIQPGGIVRTLGVICVGLVITTPLSSASAQDTGRGGRGGGRGSQTVITDTARARQLFVSNRPEDHPQANFEQQIQQRAVAESTTVAKSKGVLRLEPKDYVVADGDIVHIRSSV